MFMIGVAGNSSLGFNPPIPTYGIFINLNSVHAGCSIHVKTSGCYTFLGGDKLVSWSSKKHECTSMFSAEEEYVSLFACCTQFSWLRLGSLIMVFTLIKYLMYCDSKAAIAISCNSSPAFPRTKKLMLDITVIMENRLKRVIIKLFSLSELEYQLADMFTKALPRR
ncbi:hypothetical protein Tco_0756977 [Tanacetum coccineum]